MASGSLPKYCVIWWWWYTPRKQAMKVQMSSNYTKVLFFSLKKKQPKTRVACI